MKRGNNCHKCMVGVMGNAQHLSGSNVIVTIGENTLNIPASYYNKQGILKKKYQAVVAFAIAEMRNNAITKKAVA